jgi:hypothetical protein
MRSLWRVAVRGGGRRLPPVAIGRIEGRVERIVRFKGRRRAEHVDAILDASIDARNPQNRV